MTVASRCPRCLGGLRAPGLMSSQWLCPAHGAVQPLQTHSLEALAVVAHGSRVPLWAPVPLLPGWTLTGLASAGDERTGSGATAVALSGPSPVGGPADLVLVAEEPGTGLGARLAGVSGIDAGDRVTGPPEAKVLAAGHPTGLWRCQDPPTGSSTDAAPGGGADSPDGRALDRVAFVGEAGGVWLWAVLWPPAAELVLLEHVELQDLRHTAEEGLRMPHGAPTTRLP